MNTTRSQPRSKPRRSPSRSSEHGGEASGGFGAPAVQMAEKAPQPVLGAFYESGPALSLNGHGAGHGANGHGAAGGPADNGRNGAGGVQFKLAISRPGDPFEREADAAADRVTSGGRMPAITPLGPGALSRMATLQRETTGEEEEQQSDEKVVQPCACEEERQGSVEPPRVQRQAAEGEEEEPADLEETVQPLAIQRQAGEDEEPVDPEEVVQPLAIQRQADGEEEQEVVQPCENCDQERSDVVQRQGEEEEEEPADQENAVQQQGQEEQDPAEVQTTPADGAAVAASGNGSVSSALNHPGGGAPLAPSIRSRLEPGLGADLSGVRIHSDSAAQQTAHALKARAFTHGQDIWLGTGESPHDMRLMAHEATHAIQQTSIMGSSHRQSPSASKLVQRAEYATLGESGYLRLDVAFQGKTIDYFLLIESDLLPYFEDNASLSQSIEDELQRIYNPEDRPLHETEEYLEDMAIRQLILSGLRSLVRTGAVDFGQLENLLSGRTALFYEQNLLPGSSNWLAGQTGIDSAEIDWNILLPQLKALASSFEPTTMLEASERDRYALFLDMLSIEASPLPAVLGAAVLAAEEVDLHLLSYLEQHGSALFTDSVFEYHSESFLGEYVLLIEELEYIPEDFDLEAFRPVEDTGSIDRRREAIVSQFIEKEAQGRVVMYILDRWTESAESPEEFLEGLDVENFREELIEHLADELVDRAKRDPDLMAALRSRATDVGRFVQVAWIFNYGQTLQDQNLNLWDTFANVPIEEFSSEDYAIAADPWAYYNTSATIANTLYSLFQRLTPNGPIETDVVLAAIGILRAQDVPPAYALVFLLPELLGYLGALKNLLEEQESETARQLQERLELDFEEIREIVTNYVEHADRFVREEWIPMLKQIAEERAAENLEELRYIDEHWEDVRSQRLVGFAETAAELDFLAEGLESGRFEAVEFEGRSIGPEGAEHLRNAAKVARAAGRELLDEGAQDEQREKIRGVIGEYEQIIEDIRDGDYDPLDYSSAVYAEARERLGIVSLTPATVGMVLSRRVTTEQNPFLEYAIVRWRFKTGLERDFERAMILVGLGVLTVAAALVPGAVGVVLGAIDVGLGIHGGVKGVRDAQTMLRMARLDIHGNIVGISEADAERALTHAWIGLGLSVALTAGVGALRLRTTLRRPGGARVPRATPELRATAVESRLLSRTRDLHGSQLSRADLSAEAQMVARGRARPSTLRGFDEEIHLPNDHVWRRQGETWCRFSFRPFCMPANTLPQGLRRRAYRDVARTLDEGIDPGTGALIPNRGHSHADHGAQTTPAQHARRLRTGISPSGRNTRLPNGSLPQASSRFATHRAQLDAFELARADAARQLLAAGGSPPAVLRGTLDLPGAGMTYRMDGGTLVGGNLVGGSVRVTTVSRFRYVFRRNATGSYDLITMFPEP